MTGQAVAPCKSLIELPDKLVDLPEAPFTARNSLSRHPLFEPERITRLLRKLPRERVEIRTVQLIGNSDQGYKRGDLLCDADPVDTFERLEDKPAWMLLHETWVHDGDYGQLLKDYLENLRSQCGEAAQSVTPTGCWMFLSSGNIVVHFHADPDQSFLNQIRGSKTVYVYPARILPDAAIEEMVYKEDQGPVTYKPEYEQHMFEPVHLEPGRTVFLPLYAPHRVTNDSGFSISWNVGFHTPHSQQRDHVHRVNWELRQLGMEPSRYSDSVRDAMKAKLLLPFRIKNKLIRSLKQT
jgi:hypothetical protein